MKKIYALIMLLLTIQLGIYAQNSFQYQATLKDKADNPLAGQNINIRFSIIKESENGEAIYSETHDAQTDSNGFISLKIGEGTSVLNTFNTIDWDTPVLFVKTEIDKGDGYTLVSTQQLQSVPYTLYAAKAGGIRKKSPNGTLWSLAVDNDGQLSACKVEDTIIPIPAGFSKLVFNDEFNGAGLPDPAKWGYEVGYVRNGEEQYYTEARIENCYQQDGYLHIKLLHDNLDVPAGMDTKNGDGIAPITSASIHTRNKESWLYCKIEVRAKLPKCLGSWPAVWMMPQDDFYGGWPRSGEIDIMEHVGYDPDYIHFSLHSQKYNGTNNTHKHRQVFAPTSYAEFHTYGIEWYEDRIEWYMDGERRFTVKNSEGIWSAWPFNKSFYLILNLAFGGGWGGREGFDTSALPQEYQIDYVRVFQ